MQHPGGQQSFADFKGNTTTWEDFQLQIKLKPHDETAMGELHVHCVRGCTCNATSLVGWHARRSSVMMFGMISATPSDACTLRLTHRARGAAGRATAGSRGNVATAASDSSKFKLIAVVVPPFSLDGSDRDLQQARGFNS